MNRIFIKLENKFQQKKTRIWLLVYVTNCVSFHLNINWEISCQKFLKREVVANESYLGHAASYLNKYYFHWPTWSLGQTHRPLLMCQRAVAFLIKSASNFDLTVIEIIQVKRRTIFRKNSNILFGDRASLFGIRSEGPRLKRTRKQFHNSQARIIILNYPNQQLAAKKVL